MARDYFVRRLDTFGDKVKTSTYFENKGLTKDDACDLALGLCNEASQNMADAYVDWMKTRFNVVNKKTGQVIMETGAF